MPPLILAFFTGTYSVFDGCAACPHGVIEHALGMHGCLATGCEYSYVMNWDGTACVRCPENWDFVSTGTCAPPHANASSLGVACGEWGYVLNWDGSACVECPPDWTAQGSTCKAPLTLAECEAQGHTMNWDGTACVECPTNWTLSADGSTCVAAQAAECDSEMGYVLNWDGSACVPCPENWIVKLEKCVPKACDPPFVIGADGVTCVPCPKGWQWDGPNQCSICPAGSAAGATACSACSAGTFSTAEGSTLCSPM